MKNFAKFLGIIALAAVIGFSMTACEEEEEDNGGDPGGGGDSISWAGTWKQIEDSNGGSPAGDITLTLGADGGAWTFVGTQSGYDYHDESGTSWEHKDNLNYTGLPGLSLRVTGGSRNFSYEKISNTKIKMLSNSWAISTLNGTYEKQ